MTGRPDQCTPCAELLEWYRTTPDDGTPTVGQLLQRGLPPHVLGFRDPAATLAPTPLQHIRTT